LLGTLVLAGLIVVFVMGYYGAQSAGIFSPREAFFVIELPYSSCLPHLCTCS
jgi:hypothetical protein